MSCSLADLWSPHGCWGGPARLSSLCPHHGLEPPAPTRPGFLMVPSLPGSLSQLQKSLIPRAHSTGPHISPSLPSPGVGVHAGLPPGPVWAALDQHCAPEPAACLDTVLKGPLTLEEADSPGFCCASGDAGSTLNPPDHPNHTHCPVPTVTGSHTHCPVPTSDTQPRSLPCAHSDTQPCSLPCAHR